MRFGVISHYNLSTLLAEREVKVQRMDGSRWHGAEGRRGCSRFVVRSGQGYRVGSGEIALLEQLGRS